MAVRWWTPAMSSARRRHGTEDMTGGKHHTSQRAVPLGKLVQNADGRWFNDGVASDHRYEVICPRCGDDSGPYELQTPETQRLRGPYTLDKARAAALEHESTVVA